ncbi:hypothetical protein PMAYCL1PPCAC_11961 [Pristionchus mayeri]|uniref:Arrestin C-terminal-like domain-containing protein n=1 Tax=Pristionchus mayeri TaxID=1317129 RepID=A0AAN5CGL6_9BILA|nr:hypothetical protein PMAYCL1PPCAC_11961 [Pristionchus mayeri]
MRMDHLRRASRAIGLSFPHRRSHANPMDCFQCIYMPTLRLNMVFAHEKFMAGDPLIAKILIDSSDPDTVIDQLVVDIRGWGRTGWINVHTDKIFEKETVYWSHKTMLSSNTPVVPGRHNYPLHIRIPEECPSSYESQYGSIRYEVKVRVDSNNDQASSSETFPFLVISRSFLNKLPTNLLSPIDYSEEIDFTCCTLPFGSVSFKVHLKRTAFVIGETVEPIVHVKNRSRRQLKDVTMFLLAKSQYEARSRYEHVDEKKLAEMVMDQCHLGFVSARSNQDFDCVSLRIPFDAPPTQKYSPEIPLSFIPIIMIHYVLKLTALPGIELEIPLLVTAAAEEKN